MTSNTINTNINLRVSKLPWLILAVCCVACYLSIGTVSTSFGLHLNYILPEFNLTNTQTTFITSAKTAGQIITMFLCIPLLKKIPAWVMVSITLCITGAGFFMLSVAQNYTMILASAFLIGICYGGAGMITLSIICRNWFVKHRALSIGIFTAITGFAGTINPQIITSLIENHSFAFEVRIVALVFVIGAAICALILRDNPVARGVYPLGGEDVAYVEKAEKEEESNVKFKENTEFKADIRCHILMLAFILCLGGFNYAAWSHFSLVYMSTGWDAADVANIMSIAGFFLIPGKLLFGLISDRFAAHKTAWIFVGCCLVSMLMTATVSGVHSYALQIINFLFYGIGGVLATTGISTYAIDMSTRETYKSVVAFYVPFYSIGGMIVSPIIGKFADLSGGDYRPGYFVCAGCCVVGYILLMLSYRLARKNKQKEIEATEGTGV